MNLTFQRVMTAAATLSASALIAACGVHSTSPLNETFTVYKDSPKMSLLDGRSVRFKDFNQARD